MGPKKEGKIKKEKAQTVQQSSTETAAITDKATPQAGSSANSDATSPTPIVVATSSTSTTTTTTHASPITTPTLTSSSSSLPHSAVSNFSLTSTAAEIVPAHIPAVPSTTLGDDSRAALNSGGSVSSEFQFTFTPQPQSEAQYPSMFPSVRRSRQSHHSHSSSILSEPEWYRLAKSALQTYNSNSGNELIIEIRGNTIDIRNFSKAEDSQVVSSSIVSSSASTDASNTTTTTTTTATTTLSTIVAPTDQNYGKDEDKKDVTLTPKDVVPAKRSFGSFLCSKCCGVLCGLAKLGGFLVVVGAVAESFAKVPVSSTLKTWLHQANESQFGHAVSGMATSALQSASALYNDPAKQQDRLAATVITGAVLLIATTALLCNRNRGGDGASIS